MESNKEHGTQRIEHVEIAHRAHERSRELAEQQKSKAERYKDKEAHSTAEKARHEALKEAAFSKEQGKERRSHQADRHNATTHRHVITKTDRDESFKQTMGHVRKELPRSTRWFSDLIHHPRIESMSELVGTTVARPNAILAGGLTAFIAILGLYSYAKFAGFALQGSEVILAFFCGWLLGLLFDGVKSMLTRKR